MISLGNLRAIIVGITTSISMIFGIFFILNTHCIIINIEKFSYKYNFYYSIFIMMLYLIISIIFLFINHNIFRILFYIYFLFSGFILHCCLGVILYYLIGNIFSKFINLFILYGSGFILTLYGMYNEKNIRFDKIILKFHKYKGKSIKICHLSDLHLGPIYGRELCEKIINLIKKEDFDLILITGDILEGDFGKIKMTQEMIEPFKQISIPIYYVTGNHEEFTNKEEIFKYLTKSNIIHLKDKCINFKNLFNLIGIDYNKPYNKVKENLKNIVPKNNDLINICISHIPFFKPVDLVSYNIDLFLCGHTHGAQLFPTIIYIYLKNTVFNGLYSYINNNREYYVYVSSGVGTSGPPLRTCSYSNIGHITIEGI
jgi:hypothetical protein